MQSRLALISLKQKQTIFKSSFSVLCSRGNKFICVLKAKQKIHNKASFGALGLENGQTPENLMHWYKSEFFNSVVPENEGAPSKMSLMVFVLTYLQSVSLSSKNVSSASNRPSLHSSISTVESRLSMQAPCSTCARNAKQNIWSRNQRFGPKGQCTSLPPSPYNTARRGWHVSGWGVAHHGGWHPWREVSWTKGPVAPETTGAPILLGAFFKSSKVKNRLVALCRTLLPPTSRNTKKQQEWKTKVKKKLRWIEFEWTKKCEEKRKLLEMT